eukprot:5718096-Pleurochrysis_carterae.AAC.1
MANAPSVTKSGVEAIAGAQRQSPRKSNKSAAAFRSPTFSGAKACITPAAIAAARKKALAANETRGQERAAALVASASVAHSLLPQGIGVAVSTVGGGEGEGEGERGGERG